MATTATTRNTTAGIAEHRFLELISAYGLPEPDRIEADGAELVFMWTEQKLMVRIDLTQPTPALPDNDPTSAIS